MTCERIEMAKMKSTSWRRTAVNKEQLRRAVLLVVRSLLNPDLG